MCASRGELSSRGKPASQKKREVHYALHRKNGSVFLVQRPERARLMAGMWELPETAGPHEGKPVLIVRHSITVTNYTVNIWATEAPPGMRGEWWTIDRLPKLALTGLARKVLRRQGIFPESGLVLNSSRLTGER